jgi:CheY-like chemotaxis protein
LIVDDEAEACTLFRLMLSPYANWRVLGAETGQRAIQIAEAERPDVILLDVMMPDLNGIEVCARLRQLPHLCASKIVMLTVLHTQSSREAAAVAGADEFWTKPISPQALRSGLARLLGGDAPAPDVSHQLNSRSPAG